MGSGEGSDPNELDWPFTGEKFKAAWWAWQATLVESKRLYANRAAAQAAIDQLRDFDEAFATNLLVTAANARYKAFVFGDTRDKYRRALDGPKAKASPTDKAKGTIQDRAAKPRTLAEHLAAKDPSPNP